MTAFFPGRRAAAAALAAALFAAAGAASASGRGAEAQAASPSPAAVPLASPAPLAAPSFVPPSPAASASPAASGPPFVPAFTGPEPPPLEAPTPAPHWTLGPGAVRPNAGGASWTPESRAALRRDLDTLLADPLLRDAHVGVLAVDTRDGSVLYAREPDAVVQPASTFKLLVGSVALDRLGPEYRFETAAYALADPRDEGWLGDGVAGAVVLAAGGDPFLSVADLDEFARDLAAKGVRRIGGGLSIYVDHFSRAPYAPGWTWDDFAEDYAPKISAMTLEENVVHVFVESGGQVGAPAILHVRPIAAPVAFSGNCSTSFEPTFSGRPATGAPGSETDVDAEFDRHGCIAVTGTIAADSAGTSLDVAVPNPAAYGYRVAVDRLHEHGIDVAALDRGSPPYEHIAGLRPAHLPGAVKIWSHESPPLAEIMPRFWIPSDNLVGENLLEELTASSDHSGSRAASLVLERRWLLSIGVDPSPFTFADGCGMSQYDRISPRALVAILQHDWNGPHRELVLDALPVGGARGHIEGIDGTPAAGRVWAKTGSMMHVRGLAGYVATRTRGTVTFAFEVDDYTGDTSALAALRARVLSRIANE